MTRTPTQIEVHIVVRHRDDDFNVVGKTFRKSLVYPAETGLQAAQELIAADIAAGPNCTPRLHTKLVRERLCAQLVFMVRGWLGMDGQ